MGHLRTLKVNSSRQIGEDNQNGEFITFTLLISLEMNSGPLKTQSGHNGTNRESPRRGSLILAQIVRKGIPSIQRCWQKPLLYIFFSFLHFFFSHSLVSPRNPAVVAVTGACGNKNSEKGAHSFPVGGAGIPRG